MPAETVLIRLVLDHALRTLSHREDVRAAIDVLQNRKLLSTFGPTLAAKVNPVTGRLHPRFNIAATKAGRFSSNDPNFQQTPSGRRAPGFRDCFVAEPGYALVGPITTKSNFERLVRAPTRSKRSGGSMRKPTRSGATYTA